MAARSLSFNDLKCDSLAAARVRVWSAFLLVLWAFPLALTPDVPDCSCGMSAQVWHRPSATPSENTKRYCLHLRPAVFRFCSGRTVSNHKYHISHWNSWFSAIILSLKWTYKLLVDQEYQGWKPRNAAVLPLILWWGVSGFRPVWFTVMMLMLKLALLWFGLRFFFFFFLFLFLPPPFSSSSSVPFLQCNVERGVVDESGGWCTRGAVTINSSVTSLCCQMVESSGWDRSRVLLLLLVFWCQNSLSFWPFIPLTSFTLLPVLIYLPVSGFVGVHLCLN